MHKLISLLVLAFLSLVGGQEEDVKKIVRVELLKDGMKRVTLSDGEILVNFELHPDGEICDCKAVRRRRMALGMLKYDFDLMSEEEDVVFYLEEPEIDVQWYSRQCTKFLRDIDFPDEEKHKKVRTKQLVNKAYPGTKYCTRFSAYSNPKYVEGENAEDECCKILKGCNFYIPYMHWRHGFLNANLYDITHCDCLQTFKQCLGRLQTDLAATLNHIFFDLLSMKCFTFQPHELCHKYSTWFDQCEDSMTYLTLNIKELE